MTRYITVSKDLERYLINRVGVATERITQIYNGMDTERFTPDALKPIGSLPPDFLGENKIVIGALGHTQRVKHQATLLKAFAESRPYLFRATTENIARAHLNGHVMWP